MYLSRQVKGKWDTGILVATYEKYLALLCSTGNLELSGIVVVADEIQIIGTDGRGPEIELSLFGNWPEALHPLAAILGDIDIAV